MKNLFDSELVYNEKYLQTKKNSYNGNVNTNYNGKSVPKEVWHHICLSLILIDSVFQMGKNYYPKLIQEDCQYVVKENRMTKLNNNELEFFCGLIWWRSFWWKTNC